MPEAFGIKSGKSPNFGEIKANFMRDEFSKDVKDILSKRVGLLCSNPTCRVLTMGPNTEATKATNLGVAAHISAASPGGPRFDETIPPEARASILNAIWLCQSCAKLVDNDPLKYTVHLMTKWKITAEEYAESLLNKKVPTGIDYTSVFEHMPELIGEMGKDLDYSGVFDPHIPASISPTLWTVEFDAIKL